MPQSWDMGQILLLPPGGRHAEDFYVRKIQRLRPGLNPQTWGPEASMLTTRPLKPSSGGYVASFIKVSLSRPLGELYSSLVVPQSDEFSFDLHRPTQQNIVDKSSKVKRFFSSPSRAVLSQFLQLLSDHPPSSRNFVICGEGGQSSTRSSVPHQIRSSKTFYATSSLPRYPQNGRLCEPQNRQGRLGEGKNVFELPKIETLLLHYFH